MKTFADAVRDDRQAAEAPSAGRAAVVPLAPLLAGARARGVADGLELIGAAAALLDEQGDVLHVNARAQRLLGGDLVVAGGRLRARDGAADQNLAAAIRSTVRNQVASQVWLISDDSRADGLGVRIMPVAAKADEAFQLLRAVAIFELQNGALGGGRAGLN